MYYYCNKKQSPLSHLSLFSLFISKLCQCKPPLDTMGWLEWSTSWNLIETTSKQFNAQLPFGMQVNFELKIRKLIVSEVALCHQFTSNFKGTRDNETIKTKDKKEHHKFIIGTLRKSSSRITYITKRLYNKATDNNHHIMSR